VKVIGLGAPDRIRVRSHDSQAGVLVDVLHKQRLSSSFPRRARARRQSSRRDRDAAEASAPATVSSAVLILRASCITGAALAVNAAPMQREASMRHRWLLQACHRHL
jgi:hypothetical protein